MTQEAKKILAALDLADYSPRIYAFAASLARDLGANLIVANIINHRDVEAVRTISSMGYDVDGAHFITTVKAERQSRIKEIIQQSGFPEVSPRIVIRTGNPIQGLLDIISDEHIDMVVMGPKGRTDLSHVLVGSVAEKLFRRSPATVISYRDALHAENVKNQ
jgi:nucleotide-binding universal stress UspA family protein